MVENNSECYGAVASLVSQYKGLMNIEIYRMQECKNENVARNYEALASRGKYIFYLDSDGEYMSAHVEGCLRFMVYNGYYFIYGSMFIRDGVGQVAALADDVGNYKDGVDCFFSEKRTGRKYQLMLSGNQSLHLFTGMRV